MIDSQLIQWGIVGPGRIASQVIKDFPYVPGAPSPGSRQPVPRTEPRPSPASTVWHARTARTRRS